MATTGGGEDHRVLTVHEDVAALRLIRESLQSFTRAEVVTTPNAEYAFELALQRSYSLFVFQVSLPRLGGQLLYELIGKAYPYCHQGRRIAPGVIFLAEDPGAGEHEALRKDARVKAVLATPLKIDRLLDAVEGILPKK